jgi:hypothetical protein
MALGQQICGTRGNVAIHHNTLSVGNHIQIISHQLQVENEINTVYAE